MCRRLDRSQFSGIFEYVRCDPEISRIDEEYEKRQNVLKFCGTWRDSWDIGLSLSLADQSWIPASCTVWIVWRNLCGMYDRSFGRNDQKSSDLFKKIKFEIRDSICNLWDRIWKNARMLALFLYIFIK